MGSLTRREVLTALVGAPFAGTLLSCERAPEIPLEGELLGPSESFGHHLRDPLPVSAWANAPTRRTEVAIVGGGPAGLSAAWRLLRRGQQDLRVVELEPRLGGTSASGRSAVTPFPWGAHYLPLPPASNHALRSLLQEMGAIDDARPAEEVLVREPDERVFYQGYWYPGLYPYAGASADDLAQLARFEARVASLVDAFQIPMRLSSRAPELLALDEIDAERWLRDLGFDSPRLFWLCDYACRDDYGLRLRDTSAWAFLFYWASRADAEGESAPLLTWPEGNGALVKHLGDALGDRQKLRRLAVHVREEAEGVRVLLAGPDGDREVLVASRAILAVPRFVARRLVPQLELTTEGFDQGAWLVANLHLQNRPPGRGVGPAWDNVLYDSPSLGYVVATHQRGRETGPTVWTYYLPLCQRDPRESRRALLEAEHEVLAEGAVRDLERAHPTLRQHLGQIDIWRWGHAMTRPRVGFLRGGARFHAGAPRGRIHFAHSDLSGVAIFEEAFDHGVRAADEVMAA
ncbi:MAG: FAD-dependent oxidoreductase [Myxococcota bacterium]